MKKIIYFSFLLFTLSIYPGGESREQRDDAFDGKAFCDHIDLKEKYFVNDFR